jgi:hypothetical protein
VDGDGPGKFRHQHRHALPSRRQCIRGRPGAVSLPRLAQSHADRYRAGPAAGQLVAAAAAAASAGFQLLFDGVSTAGWSINTIVNQPGRNYPGTFHLIDAGLESDPGTELGLFYTQVPFSNYVLKLEWLIQ